MSRPQQMSAHPEEILYDTMDGREALQMNGRLEAPHLAFPLSRRLVRDLGAVVRVLIPTRVTNRETTTFTGGSSTGRTYKT